LHETTIPLRSHDEAILVLGPYDRFAKLLRQALDIEVFTRTGNLRLKGPKDSVDEAERRIEHVLGKSRKGRELGLKEIEVILLGGNATTGAGRPGNGQTNSTSNRPRGARTGVAGNSTNFRVRPIEPRNESQRRYWECVDNHDLTFGLGSAGTGKTFLAVAQAVGMLRRGQVRRLIITRPVVEAGENLGFLPGDLHEKLDPYMRPIYDALFELIDPEALAHLEEANVIEIAPLAYMRGRTLSNAFVILDEAQNTTVGQMKMFLTRFGEGSKVVVTGDPSQNDLPRRERSGLGDAVDRLRGFEGIGVSEFGPQDVVRHPLVAAIVRAYQPPAPSDRATERSDDRSEDDA
jgi:phosphate starvation-inducible protein PhoH and related proteins